METREFSARLKELREQAGLSQGELADKVGVNFSYLSKIESGVRPPPSEKVILRLAEALDADRDELMALAGKVPSDIAEILKSRENLQLLRSGRKLKKSRSADKKESFDIRLRELREQAGLSQRELADNIGINFTYLSKIESRALPPPSKEVIQRLAEVLNTDKDELMTLAGKVPSDIAQILKNRETLQLLRSGRAPKKSKAADKKGGISIMKNLVNYKMISRVAVPIVLVLAIGASLWFSSPAPVRALTIEITGPAGAPLTTSGTLGDTYSFSVTVNIEEATDVLPVHHIDLEIYNVGSPTTYIATVTNLPIPGTGLATDSKSYTSTETSGGAVTVSVETAYGWVWASGYRYGYGYREPAGQGYLWFGTNFGYGYGYNGNQGATSITYTVVWTSPSGWPEGEYKIKTLVYGNGNKKFSGTSASFSLSLTTPPVYYYSPTTTTTTTITTVATPGVSSVPALRVDEGGIVQADSQLTTSDQKVSLDIAKDTELLDAQGKALKSISAEVVISPPAPPPDASIVSLTYDLGPDDATFDPAIPLTVTYDADEIPEGVLEDELYIAYWDGTQWVALESTVDTTAKTATAEISHFTQFAVIGSTVPPPVVPPVEEVEVPPTPAVFTTSSLTISPTEVNTGDKVTIGVLVTNTGELSGSYTVTLKINDVAVDTKDVTLDGGGSQRVSFTAARDVVGTYTVSIDDLSGTLTVTAPPVEVVEVPPVPIAWWVWLIVGLAAAAVIGVTYYWLIIRRQRA